MLKIHFLVPDSEHPGTLEISTFYFLTVFVQFYSFFFNFTLHLSDSGYPGLLLKSEEGKNINHIAYVFFFAFKIFFFQIVN